MEGMFLINIKSWITLIGDYAEFLLKQHIYPFYRGGSSEVHVVFDDPNCQGRSPKNFERQRRSKTNPVPENHLCRDFSADMAIPLMWRENVLNCRKCKRNLVCFISDYFLKIIHSLHAGQKFVTSGGFDGELQNKAMFMYEHFTKERQFIRM